MRSTIRILLLVAGLVLWFELCRRFGLDELVAAAGRADPVRFFAFLGLTTVVFSVWALRWSVVLRGMSDGAPIPSLGTLVAFRAAEHAVSTLLPSAHLSGEPVRTYLLRRRGIDWTRAIASVAMDRMLDVTSASVFGPAYVGVFFAANHVSAKAAPWILGGMTAASLGLVAFFADAYRRGTFIAILGRRGFGSRVAAHLEGIDRLLTAFLRTRGFVLGLVLSFVAEALVIVELWMLASAFGLDISVPTLVGVMVGMGVAQIVPVPGAVGSLEATEVGVVTLAGGPAALGLAVGLVVRLRETLWIAVGLAALYLEGLSWRGAERVDSAGSPFAASGLRELPSSDAQRSAE